MSTPLIQRPHYFSGEALVTDDFVCEQQYHMTIQSLNNRSLYTYGVARGLDVIWDAKTGANQVEVRPGMAIDRLGQQIILLDAQVVQLTDVVPGATYFLTINYHQVYADYENQTGVAGYKRIVELPQIRYVRNLQDPGLNILLAVIGFSDQGAVNSLTYKSGAAARRYVSSTLGALTLITEGAGVYGGKAPGIFGAKADPLDDARYPSLRAKKETQGDAVYLELDATHSVFSGFVSTQGNLGVGASQPASNLQVDSITFKGPGTLSSNGVTVTLSEPVAPFFQVGDVLTSDPPVLTITDGVPVFGVSQTRTITRVNPARNQVTVDLAFDPALQAIPYTYVRTTLVRFSGSGGKTLFDMRIDGGVDIGVQAMATTGIGQGGRGALTITPSRQVGIALTDRNPQATLDVNGTIAADALVIGAQIQTGSVVASGTVYAQSFDGNGSKLKGLPILSYWTRETIGTPTSNLYYTQGNVGILNNNPIASLTVGSGPAFVGKGVLTAISDGVLIGYQTAFSDQIMVGDSITVGVLVEQVGIVAKIVDDEHLELEQQMPIPLTQSAYRYQPPGVDIDYDKATDGPGTISTSGIAVVGKDTKFTSTMSVGGAIIVKRFKASDDTTVQTMLVKAIKSQTELTLTQQNGEVLTKAVQFDANNSAYVVSPALLALMQANNKITVADSSATLPPALAVTTNGNKDKPNTVAINTELSEIDTDYALQVTGDVNFGTGTLDVDHLNVKTLAASQSVTVASDGTVDTLLAVGASGAAPLLTVNKTHVVVGPTSADYALDAQGVIHASGNLVTGATLQGAALAVAGNRIATNGSTQMIGTRVAYDQSALTQGGTYFTETASTDGYVMATVGEPTYTGNYAGALSGATYSGSTRTSFVYATGLSYLYDTGSKKSGKSYTIPVPGAFTMPVRNGERWELTLTWNSAFGGPPKVEFYWIPMGMPPDAMAAEAPPATLAGGGMGAMLDQLRDDLQSGRLRASMEQSAQQAITQRMDDLTRVFGDATGMSPENDARQRFMHALAQIVCAPAEPRSSESPEFAGNVQSLIDVFARVTSKDFTAEQRALLAAGVRALVQINDNDANRHDLVLIKSNVDLFIDNVQQVLGTQFDSSQRRLLTRALVRLVGDGSAPGGGG